MTKRIISLVMILALMLTLFAVTAYAEGEKPGMWAKAGEVTAYEGETLYLPIDGELYVCFDIEGYDGSLIPGWRNDLIKQQGFEIDDEPTFFENDNFSYAHIKPGSKEIGECGTLTYSWYRIEDIFGEDAPGWIDAVPVYTSSVIIEVTGAADDETDDYLGDADGSGDVTILDATAIQRTLASLSVDSFDEKTADADGDNSITILDATAIQRYLAGLSCPEGIGALITAA